MSRAPLLEAVALLLFFVGLLSNAEGACSQFGHSCFGAHGKRSGDEVLAADGPAAVGEVLSADLFGDYENQGVPSSRPNEYLEVPGSRADEYPGAPGSRSDEYPGAPGSRADEYLDGPGSKSDEYLGAPGLRSDDYESQGPDYYDGTPSAEPELRQKLLGVRNGDRRGAHSPWSHMKTSLSSGRPVAGVAGDLLARMSPHFAIHRPSDVQVPAGRMMELQRADKAGSLQNFKNWLLGVMQDTDERQQRPRLVPAIQKRSRIGPMLFHSGPRHQFLRRQY